MNDKKTLLISGLAAVAVILALFVGWKSYGGKASQNNISAEASQIAKSSDPNKGLSADQYKAQVSGLARMPGGKK